MAPRSPATEPLITATQIAARVDELASEINQEYEGVDELVLIGVLKGSFIFLADLARRITVPHRIEFIAVSSYGATERTDHPGDVRLIMDIRHPVNGAHVLLVEDIVDTGYTITYLQRLISARGPASLRTCALVRKLERAEIEAPVDYLGFDIPDVWVVGYGLDWAERFRTLPDICVVDPNEAATESDDEVGIS